MICQVRIHIHDIWDFPRTLIVNHGCFLQEKGVPSGPFICSNGIVVSILENQVIVIQHGIQFRVLCQIHILTGFQFFKVS